MQDKNSPTSIRKCETYDQRRVCYAVLLFFLSVPLFLMGQEKNDQDVFDKMYVGVFDPDAWNGIVFDGTAYGQRVPFAIRVRSKSGRFLDGERIFDAVSTVGPHAPDGSYALLSWRHYPRTAPVTLEWSRIDRTTVVEQRRPRWTAPDFATAAARSLVLGRSTQSCRSSRCRAHGLPSAVILSASNGRSRLQVVEPGSPGLS